MDKLTIVNKHPYYFTQLGKEKTFFVFDNADALSVILFYHIYHFKSFEYDGDVDRDFWYSFIDFFCKTYHVKRHIKFTSTAKQSIADYKKNKAVLFYSGGKDSELSKLLLPDVPTVQILNEENPHNFAKEKIITNITNLFWLRKKPSWNVFRIEMLIPFLSSYTHNWVGIEKEFWDYSEVTYGFDLEVFRGLLNTHNLDFDSKVKDHYSPDIVKKLYNENIEFVKCNIKKESFCYRCAKCDILYAGGMDGYGFDKKQFENSMLVSSVKELLVFRKSVVGKRADLTIILNKIYNKFVVGEKYDTD